MEALEQYIGITITGDLPHILELIHLRSMKIWEIITNKLQEQQLGKCLDEMKATIYINNFIKEKDEELKKTLENNYTLAKQWLLRMLHANMTTAIAMNFCQIQPS